jgi:hypothetical protein
MPQQTTHQLLLIRPANFGFNPETAANNAFQKKLPSTQHAQVLAQAEFDQLVATLRANNIQVLVIDDSPNPLKTDAVFPNNWLSCHTDGTLVTYPMWSANRRLERRKDIVEQLQKTFGFREHWRLEYLEAEEVYLEGTGSMVLDRVHRWCYACRSPRTQERALNLFCERFGYQLLLFDAVDEQGQAIYHTNVMMALGEDFVVVGLDTVRAAQQRKQLETVFEQTGKRVVTLSQQQLKAFAGNMLQVRNTEGTRFLLLSAQARQALTPKQIQVLEHHTRLLSSPIPIIETLGGGSLRCMVAEVFLPNYTNNSTKKL